MNLCQLICGKRAGSWQWDSMNMKLQLDKISAVENLFKEKNWPIERDQLMFSSTFNRFCYRLSLFDEEQQSLIIELAHHFRDIGINDFQEYFCEAIKEIDFTDFKAVLVAPLKPLSVKETKSSNAIWYYLKSYSDFSYKEYDRKLFFIDNWEEIQNTLSTQQALLLLVDDFIGTGETVIETLDELIESGMITKDSNFKVVSFLAQEAGINKVSDNFGKIACVGEILKRGITDRFEGDELERKRELMIKIETSIKVKEGYSFGYGGSESLVAFNRRSANNTFPVFWLEKKNKLAPFKR